MSRLAHKRALVTGGTSGIGEALVHRLTVEGARVVFCARNADEGARVAREVPGSRFVPCDVTDAPRVAELVSAAVAHLGGLDLVVTNAGGAVGFSQWPNEPPEEWQRTVDLNLNGTTFVCQQAWPHLAQSPAGAVVMISSLSARMAVGPDQLAKMGGGQPPASYQASKAAVDGLLVHLAGVGGAEGIRVNAVRPGRILTERMLELFGGNPDEALFWSHYREVQLLKRHGHVDDVCHAVVYLGSDEAGFVTGQILDVNGGAIAGL